MGENKEYSLEVGDSDLQKVFAFIGSRKPYIDTDSEEG